MRIFAPKRKRPYEAGFHTAGGKMSASHACPTCSHQNRLGAKFCQKCGATLTAPDVTAPTPATANRYQPTLPLPAKAVPPASAPPLRQATASRAPDGIAKTLMRRGEAPPLPVAPMVAAPYQLAPAPPARSALPGWLWFLLGVLAGVGGTVAVLQYGSPLLSLLF